MKAEGDLSAKKRPHCMLLKLADNLAKYCKVAENEITAEEMAENASSDRMDEIGAAVKPVKEEGFGGDGRRKAGEGMEKIHDR